MMKYMISGIISSEGELWNQHRKFGQNVFRECGVGRTKLEDNILDEQTYFIKRIQETNGEIFDPSNAIMAAVSNIICAIVYGSRFEYNDPKFLNFIDINNKAFAILGNSGPLTAFPFLRFLPGDPFKCYWLKDMRKYVIGEDTMTIEQHQKTMTPGVVRDYIDAYLLEMEKEKQKDTLFHSESNKILYNIKVNL